jgi:hypothetical protein
MDLRKARIDPAFEKAWNMFQADLKDFRSYAKKFLRIKDEVGNIIPFVLNALQEKVLVIMLDLESRGLPIWLIILKCRQTGISTLIEAFLFWRTHQEHNQKCLIIGHDTDSSQNLFAMYQRYYECLPQGIQPLIDRNQRDKKLSYKETKNEVVIQTAGSNIGGEKAGTGRSATFQYIHATECAFYPDYKTTFAALLQASKKAKLIVLETTANGFNDFRNDWISAKLGESDYVTIFLSWLEFYDKPFRDDDEKNRLLRDLGSNLDFNLYPNEEQILIDDYSATLENLNWRRWAIVNLCKKDINTFHQEYPRDDQEAFVSTGTPVFATHITSPNFAKFQKLEQAHKLPLAQGNLEVVYDLVNEDYQSLINIGMTSYMDLRKFIVGVKFVPDRNGFIKIFGNVEHKQGEQFKFVGAADVAEGLLQGDYSVVEVLNRETKEICLEWHGHLDVDLFACEIHKLQLFFENDIHFGIEKNNQGLAVIVKAEQLGVNLYYAEEFRTGIAADTEKLGFSTDQNTRRYALNNLIEWVRDGLFVCKNSAFWSECMTFVKNPKGKMQAQNKDRDPGTKCYDDRILASGILTVVHQWVPNFTKEEINRLPYHLERKINKIKGQLTTMSE